MKQKTKKIKNRLIGILGIIFIFVIIMKSVYFYSEIIKGLNVSGICFYSILIIIIVFYLGRVFEDILSFTIRGEFK